MQSSPTIVARWTLIMRLFPALHVDGVTNARARTMVHQNGRLSSLACAGNGLCRKDVQCSIGTAGNQQSFDGQFASGSEGCGRVRGPFLGELGALTVHEQVCRRTKLRGPQQTVALRTERRDTSGGELLFVGVKDGGH